MIIALNAVLLLVSAMWLMQTAGGLRATRSMPKPIEPDEIEEHELDDVFVSIIVAARDEVGRVEETVVRALAQEGVRCEVIAVDDRSTDGTGESLDALAATNPSLHVEHVEELPDGWLGKCHALHRGSIRAQGDWLLFLDADTHLEPHAVAGALAAALRDNADHVTLLPDLIKLTFWGQVAMGSFMSQMGDRAMKVNRDHPRLFMGIGAFNLVRRDTYDDFGGHERLRLQVVDDMVLGLCVRKIGGRTRSLDGLEAAQIEYGSDLPSMIRLFEKNGYAALNYNDLFIVAMPILVLIVVGGALVGPVLALLLNAWAGWIAFIALALSALPVLTMHTRAGWSALAMLLTPIGHVFFLFAILRSTFITKRRGGITWRETFYPLKDLKAARLSWRVGVRLPEMEQLS